MKPESGLTNCFQKYSGWINAGTSRRHEGITKDTNGLFQKVVRALRDSMIRGRSNGLERLGSSVYVVAAVLLQDAHRRTEHLRQLRIRQHLPLGSVERDATLLQQNHALDRRHDLLDMVRHEDQRRPGASDLLHLLQEPMPRHDVE